MTYLFDYDTVIADVELHPVVTRSDAVAASQVASQGVAPLTSGHDSSRLTILYILV